MTSRFTDVAEKIRCPHCGAHDVEMRGNRRCYGVGLLLVTNDDGSQHLSPDGWN